MKTGSKALAILLLFVGLVLVNYLASSIPARVDATAESIYSLSPGTKTLLGKIEEPVALDLYFSKDATGLPIAYKNYAARVTEMLRLRVPFVDSWEPQNRVAAATLVLFTVTAAATHHWLNLADVSLLVHGTTLVTNAILERKLPPTALVT